MSPTNRPNIVFILTDDQRNDTLGCAGHPVIKTPVIDRLASQGMRFTNSFVTTSICAASRASFLCGVTERTHGYTFGKPPVKKHLVEASYPALLKKAGYRTGFFGKFGIRIEGSPDIMFDSFANRDRPYKKKNGHVDELNTRDALAFLESCTKDQPFCLSVSYSSAHAEDGNKTPGEFDHYRVIEKMRGRYKDAPVAPPKLNDPAVFEKQPGFLKTSLNRVRYFWRWDTPEKYATNMRAYYGLVSGIDYMAGELIAKLKEKGFADNTVIIYAGDNGYYMGNRGFAGKWSHYEESLRIPLIVYDPRLDPATMGKTSGRIALNLDVAATILDCAGIPAPEHYQGRSLLPLLHGKTPESWRHDLFCEHLMNHPQLPKWEGVRGERYVYACYFGQVPEYEFLHDLEKDPDQLTNFAGDPGYRKILAEFRNRSSELKERYERAREEKKVLFDFSSKKAQKRIRGSDAKFSFKETASGTTLQVKTGHTQRWPGITLQAPSSHWDLSSWKHLNAMVYNPSDSTLTVHWRIDNKGADGGSNCETIRMEIPPRREKHLLLSLSLPLKNREKIKLFGMRGNPPVGTKLDPSVVTQFLFFVSSPKRDHVFDIRSIFVSGKRPPSEKPLDAEALFPMIDKFGQYIHKEWPGKTHSEKELKAHGKKEEKDLAAHPAPDERNKYGGWSGGPEFAATGFFHVKKYRGKWFLVDPEGRLFWSHGIDCVHSRSTTPISDREHYFAYLPDEADALSTFYSKAGWAPHGYYKDHSPYRTFDFAPANLVRKYGESWEKKFAEVTHRRLRSWGLNTIANWSGRDIYLMRKTPYVCTIHTGGRTIEGSSGYWGKFYDVFDPGFRRNVRRKILAEKGKTVGDPWCIGIFVDNELSWGSETSLAEAALKSPAGQSAKIEFVNDLKKKYSSIDKLNSTWGAKYSSWEGLLKSTAGPDREKALPDLQAFYTKIAETYFRTIREELKNVAPHQLYLGCRFAWVNERAARAAAEFCDVVSYNRYRYSVEEFTLPEGIDKPAIIGEFHFGALDRGMFHTGLRKARNQEHRAQLYKEYVQGALKNPFIVGTHWFQYKDQATTGRGDGENYQIGFVDICDKPYDEIVRECRNVGYTMYRYRLEN